MNGRSPGALLLCLLPLACNPVQDLERFDVDGEQVVSIPGKNLVSDPLSVIPVDGIADNLSQSVSQSFENQGVDTNDVDSFVAKSVTLEVLGPADRNGNLLQDLRFLDQVRFVLQAEGVAEAVVAESASDAFGVGVFRYDFVVDSNHNLKDFLAAPSMTLRVDATANDRPGLGCDLRFATTFTVDVNPAGLLD
ncbi:MAG: hypothetical protein ABIJ09_11290 [Pseudomonadota bacterium]